MTSYEFIFSNKPAYRLYRHISFWLTFILHFFIQNLIIGSANEALHPRSPLESLISISYFLPIYLIAVYIFIEIVIPAFLFKRRYVIFFISAAGLLLFNFTACYYSGVLYEHVEWKMPYGEITFGTNKYHAIVNGGFISVMILGIAGGIKLSKKWFQKQRENEALEQQKIASELQLLKIQINPRFLFHSLHTVKQHILINSPQSPKLILQVADLLSYILYESDREYVMLEKELGIIKDYTTLEENTVGGNLPINIKITGDTGGKYITPLILLSVVETGFEYFLEKAEQEFALMLDIEIAEAHLNLLLEYTSFNNNFFEPFDLNEKFSGTRRQLHNLYPGSYQFNIESIPGKVSILLKNLPVHFLPSPPEVLQTLSDTYESV